MTPDLQIALAKQTASQLFEYCLKRNWAGFDPYDALNSRVFQNLPLRNSKWMRLVLTQGMKRSPINSRPLLLVPRTQNPKGLALFLSALVKLSRVGLLEDEGQSVLLAESLMGLRTKETPYWCWGYSFDWQTRTELIPRGSPNIICTTFAANALLDAYERGGNATYREAAVGAAKFVLDRLYCPESEGFACFNYTPLERTQIHNANLLGAALLCRVASCTGERKFLAPALCATRLSVKKQNKDGSWYYGEREQPSQKWIDNFHTGFNLCALRKVGQYATTNEFDASLSLGLDYYEKHFFEKDGAPKYFHNQTYPIDAHSVAQSIITLVCLEDLRPQNSDLLFSIFQWAHENMWDQRGYFYYQKHRFWTNRIPYLRWSQAWMLLALASILEKTSRRSRCI